MKQSLLFLSILSALFLSPFLYADEDPSRVLVVYRDNHMDLDHNGMSDSKELALYYQAKRAIPASNLLGVTTTTFLAYHSNAQCQLFFQEIVLPLRQKIDALGRNNIDYIVLCKGVPWNVKDYSISTHLAALYSIGSDTLTMRLGLLPNPFHETSPGIAADKGYFDHTYHLFTEDPMYLVTELDGVTFQNARELIDRALYAEKYVYPADGYYTGIGYVDTRMANYSDDTLRTNYPLGYGSYYTADLDMAMSRLFITDADFECRWENTLDSDAPENEKGWEIGDTGAYYSNGSRADKAPNALWYGGWYNYTKYNLNAWRWIPGAVACDLNSNSMENITNISGCFGAGALYLGVTALCGVINEPGLSGHTQPEKLLYYILNGYNFAEAAYHALPYLGWKTRNIGDPLYNPMKLKTPTKDDVPPPIPTVTCSLANTQPAQVNIHVTFATNGRGPDLALCKVEYGLSENYDSLVDFGQIGNNRYFIYHMTHDVTLQNLLPDTLYHINVTLKDPVENLTESGDLTFSTYAVGIKKAISAWNQKGLCLDDPIPNPFNPATQLSFSLAKTAKTELSIFNAQGKKMITLVSGVMEAGCHSVAVRATGFPSGLYFCSLRTNDAVLTKKMVIVR